MFRIMLAPGEFERTRPMRLYGGGNGTYAITSLSGTRILMAHGNEEGQICSEGYNPAYFDLVVVCYPARCRSQTANVLGDWDGPTWAWFEKSDRGDGSCDLFISDEAGFAATNADRQPSIVDIE